MISGLIAWWSKSSGLPQSVSSYHQHSLMIWPPAVSFCDRKISAIRRFNIFNCLVSSSHILEIVGLCSEDIESRIAEIFLSQKDNSRCHSSENVDDMMKLIGKPEDFDQPGNESGDHGPSFGNPGPRKKMSEILRIQFISGVCGGIGAYLNSDPVWIRILFVIFTFLFGIGFFVYIALWITIPSALTDFTKREMYGGQHNWAMPQGMGSTSREQAGSCN